MDMPEMHKWFRQYAQQMGMQNYRAILPEQIDSLINTATIDIVSEIVNNGVAITNGNVITDNAKLGTVNALRTLYKVKTLTIDDEKTLRAYKTEPYRFNSESLGNVLYFVDFSIRYSTNLNANVLHRNVASTKAAYDAALEHKRKIDAGEIDDDSTAANEALEEATANYNNAKAALEEAGESALYTRWFPIRIVDDAYLADIINDWSLAPRMRTPAMVIYSKEDSDSLSQFELYTGENDEVGIKTIAFTSHIGQIRCSYIKEPNKVRLVEDLNGNNVNSDLPEQLQLPMLKHAVDLYRVSVSGDLYAKQQSADAQQREYTRNNARPNNEAYQ